MENTNHNHQTLMVTSPYCSFGQCVLSVRQRCVWKRSCYFTWIFFLHTENGWPHLPDQASIKSARPWSQFLSWPSRVITSSCDALRHCERRVCETVIKASQNRKMTHFTVRIWAIRSKAARLHLNPAQVSSALICRLRSRSAEVWSAHALRHPAGQQRHN